VQACANLKLRAAQKKIRERNGWFSGIVCGRTLYYIITIWKAGFARRTGPFAWRAGFYFSGRLYIQGSACGLIKVDKV
jgi:hypothetical protein